MAQSSIPFSGHNFKDMRGQKFGRLTALEPVRYEKGIWFWSFRCDCGTETVTRGIKVRYGSTRSCGCLRREAVRENGRANAKHGRTGTAEYRIWSSIISRCTYMTPMYARYSGRGITVCQRWRESFEAFFADMGPRPSSDHSVERKDNSGNYEPGNCVWATRNQQARNRRSSSLITFAGETRTIAEWAETIGIPQGCLGQRIRHGWTAERTLTTPQRATKRTKRAKRLPDPFAASPARR